MSGKVLILLPAYNEEQNLPGLLDRIRAVMEQAALRYQVLVIDDGSTDGTAEHALGRAAEMPITVERHVANLGLGAALRSGFDLALRLAGPADAVVTMDSDETHDPALIPRMVNLLGPGCDVVIASRYQQSSKVHGVPAVRRLLSTGASWLFRLLLPIKGVRDFTCGFRAYSARALRAGLSAYEGCLVEDNGFQCMADVLLKLRRLPISFREVPMTLRYDLKRGASKMKVARTVGRTLRLLLRRRFAA